MQSIVTSFIKRNQLLTQNATVLIGVSGGPDSMALLHYYRSIREKWNLTLIAVSVDHQLRGVDSKEDVAYVEDMCNKWNIKFVAVAVDVQYLKKQKNIGTQIAARELRYQSFAEQMKMYQADYLALGHHADDQIETMLMGFVRSSSPVALSGIPMMRKFYTGSIVRPFLCVKKSDILEYCTRNNIKPRIDLSNEDINYTRNYFRGHIIPIVKERNNKLHTTVQRLSESLQADEHFLKKQASQAFYKVVNFKEGNKEASFSIKEFKSNPLALQRRVYHLILDYLYNQLPENLSYAHADAFFALLEKSEGHTVIDFPDHLQIQRSYETITFFFKSVKPSNNFHQRMIQIPGETVLSNQAKLITSYTDQLPENSKDVLICVANNVSLPLFVRTRKQGDRMSWQGLNGTKKIKDVFIDEKVPRKERDTWPIVVDSEGEILWLIGLRKGSQILNLEGDPLYITLKYEVGHI